jgi:hypothetical protein
MNMRLSAAVGLVLWFVISVACAHVQDDDRASDLDHTPKFAGEVSTNGTSCLDYVEFEGHEDVAQSVLWACEQFSEARGISQAEIRDALRGTRIEVMEGRTRPPCSQYAPGCAFIYDGRADVYVERRRWSRFLPNAIYRLLLVRLEPDRPVDEHNERLLELGLCKTGFACGQFYPPCPNIPDGGRADCDSILR